LVENYVVVEQIEIVVGFILAISSEKDGDLLFEVVQDYIVLYF
jgi:hypothetical protein